MGSVTTLTATVTGRHSRLLSSQTIRLQTGGPAAIWLATPAMRMDRLTQTAHPKQTLTPHISRNLLLVISAITPPPAMALPSTARTPTSILPTM